MWNIAEHFKVRLGGVTFIDVPNLVDYKGSPLFTLKRHDDTGYLGIYFEIYDERGKRVASVKRNEIYFGDKDAYQIVGSSTTYELSERKSGVAICTIKRYEAAHPVDLDVSVRLYTPSGFLFNATPEGTNLGNAVISGSTITGGTIGIAVR
jgi:hypothetical protein